MSNRRLRASLMAGATAAVLTACGNDEPRTEQLGYQDGTAPGEPISVLEALTIYFVLPAVILLTVAALVWLPGMVRASRYRPGRGWTAAPLWFGGPPDPAAAVESAQTGDLVRGGASGDW